MIPLVNNFLDACQVWRQRHPNQPMDMHLQQLIVKIVLCIRSILMMTLMDRVRQKIGDGCYRIYSFHYPRSGRYKETIRQQIHPAIAPRVEMKAERGIYYDEQKPKTYEEGMIVINRILAASDPTNEDERMTYTRENVHKYHDPDFRETMARQFFEDSCNLTKEAYDRRELYKMLVRLTCAENLNRLWWEEYQEKDKESRRKLFASVAPLVGPAAQNGMDLFFPDVPPLTHEERYGRPESVEEIKEVGYYIQTPEEHRQEWNEMRLANKITKMLCVDRFTKKDLAIMGTSWIVGGSALVVGHGWVVGKLMNK